MILDWREMFIRHSKNVEQAEGVSFIYPSDWSEEEWEAIKEAVNPYLLYPLRDYPKEEG